MERLCKLYAIESSIGLQIEQRELIRVKERDDCYKNVLFIISKIHRKGNIIVYTEKINADSRYYIFHREILYRAGREIKFIFKRKKYLYFYFLPFLLFNGAFASIGDLICSQHIPSRRILETFSEYSTFPRAKISMHFH